MFESRQSYQSAFAKTIKINDLATRSITTGFLQLSRKIKSSYHGWTLKEENIKLCSFTSPEGTVHNVFDLEEFAKSVDLGTITLSTKIQSFSRLRSGITKSYRGWILTGNKKVSSSFISPNGEIHANLVNLSEFARSISSSEIEAKRLALGLSNLRTGRKNTYKGWKILD